ncbi:MAG: polysaccharide biosynthesis tyrosine autokinase [Alphaproteobacteria bacterium]|nr:polysaccharide biosynthesis tyrosine autokinase [Alphaproteobacteria bacterium]
MINDWKLDVGHLARAILAQRYFVLIGTALLTLLGIGLLSMKEDQYAASAMILVDDRSLNVPEAEAIIEDGAADAESLLSHVELIKSANVLRRAVLDLSGHGVALYDDAEASGGFLSSVAAAIPARLWPDDTSGPVAGESQLATRLSPELRTYLRNTDVTTIGRSRLIQVTFNHTEPERAAAGANALADAYVTVQREEQVAIGNDAVQWMVEQAASLRKKSSAADQAVETFRRDSGLLQSGGSRLIEQKITETQTQLTSAELDSIALGSKVGSIEAALQRNNPFAVTEIADAESVRELRTQVSLFQAELADLEATYGQNHPLLVAKKEQIALTRRSLNNEIENIVSGFRNQAKSAQQRVAALQQVLTKQEQELADANLRGVELRDLEKEARIGNEVLEGFLGRLQQTAAREDVRAQPLELRVVSRAEIPAEPSGPPRALLSIVCLVGGFLVSSSAAMFREASRRVIREPDDLKAIAPNSGVWVIPRREGPRGAEAENLHHLITATPYAHFSASIRNTYRQTVATLPDEQHTVMLTSAQPGDGKTTMSLCFAEVVANTGRSVVLVDTDFRRPKIHVHTGLGRIAGLSDWLEGTEPLRCKRPEGSEFYTITAGSGELSHPDRWNTQTIRELLETLKGRFDTVLLDTPPVAALADPFLVAAESSMVLFVTRWQHTKIAYVRDLIAPLAERTPRIELILTDVDLKGAAAHGYKAPMEYYQDTAAYYTE